MPRLLLVDDNPSIHKIAETLLASTPIELVCVDSAAAALKRVDQGEHFDVALLDTAMAGMDGWELLDRLRKTPATSRIPIAMMAGVLDTVDPERIQAAPIQGFLKKPVEFRDLGDRVQKLLETPVVPLEPPLPAPVPASPFATMPATRLSDLPEFRRNASEISTANEDLLELTEEDLYPEPAMDEPVETLSEPLAEETLDLEELDLESLRGLSVPEPEPVHASEPTPLQPLPPVEELSDLTPPSGFYPSDLQGAVPTLDRLPEFPEPAAHATLHEEAPSAAEVELPDLGPMEEGALEASSLQFADIEQPLPVEPLPEPAPAPVVGDEMVILLPPPPEAPLDWSDESETLLEMAEPSPEAPLADSVLSIPDEDLELLEEPLPDFMDEAPLGVTEEVSAPPEKAPESEEPVITEGLDLTALVLEAGTPEIQAGVPVMELAPAVAEAAPEAVHEPAPEPLPPAEPAAGPRALSDLPGPAREALEAALADPALMDALAKAVVARLGDQVLREIAWEVIPELAERIPRS